MTIQTRAAPSQAGPWTAPVVLVVHAYDLDERLWTVVYQGGSDVAADGSSSYAAAVTGDPPEGLGTWAWWFERDSAGHQGPDFWSAPVTTAGKNGPHGAAMGT